MTQHVLQGRTEDEVLWFRRRSIVQAAAVRLAHDADFGGRIGRLPARIAPGPPATRRMETSVVHEVIRVPRLLRRRTCGDWYWEVYLARPWGRSQDARTTSERSCLLAFPLPEERGHVER